MLPLHRDILELLDQGLSYDEVAGRLGIERRLVPDRVRNARAALAREDQDPAMRSIMEGAGTGLPVKNAWLRTKTADGDKVTVHIQAPSAEVDPDAIQDRIEKAVKSIPTAPKIVRPGGTDQKLCNLYPCFDMHLALRVGEYGTAKAVERIYEGFTDVQDRAPVAAEAIILDGGDITHQSDDSNQTPKNKHPLTVDNNYSDTLDVALGLAVWRIERSLERADLVHYAAIGGNHDPYAALTLQKALAFRYEGNDRVKVYTKDQRMWAHVFGKNLLLGHHGDVKRNAVEKAFPQMVVRYRQEWGEARYCELNVGHLHHLWTKDFDFGTVVRNRPVCAWSPYDIDEMYGGASEMTCRTYHERGGLYSTSAHVFEPESHEQFAA